MLRSVHRVVAEHVSCETAVVAGENVLFVTIRAPLDVSDEALHTSLLQLATAFDVVEDSALGDLQLLEWEKHRGMDNSIYWVLRREFTDPDYPRRLDFALQSIRDASVH
jgi:hypothetical protein